MSAQTANRNVPDRIVTSITLGAKAGVHVFAGALVFNDAGWARGGTPTATTPVLGISRGEVNNGGGANGQRAVTAERGRAYLFAVGASADALTAADVGTSVYAVDDQTVGKTNGDNSRPTAGILVAIDDTGAWVKIG